MIATQGVTVKQVIQKKQTPLSIHWGTLEF